MLTNTRRRHKGAKCNIGKIMPLVVEELMHDDFTFEYIN